MAKKTMYKVAGEDTLFKTIGELSEWLGEKVTKRDVVEGNIDGIEAVEVDDEEVTPVDPTQMTDDELIGSIPADDDDIEEDIEEEDIEEEDIPEDDTEDTVEDSNDSQIEDEDSEEEIAKEEVPTTNKHQVSSDLMAKLAKITKPKEEKKSKKAPKIELKDIEEFEFPEKGTFADIKDIKKYYKQLPTEYLDAWLELEGLEWKACDNESINRMRRCMAISDYHFPKEPSKSSKKKSKYSDYETEQLVEMCVDNNIQIKDTKGDSRILRMYCIMALREANIIE